MPVHASGLSYSEAAAQLRRVGCAHAQGDALAAMYAQLAQRTLALSTRTIDKLYEHLRSHSEMGHEIKRLLRDPMAVFEII